MNPAELTIAELRERLLQGDEPVSPQLLGKLRRDPRCGVRDLADVLERRRAERREARARLDAMLAFERALWGAGVERLGGVDEAGMGPLAGPVVAAAVVFPPGTEIEGVDDSKRLDPEVREELAGRIGEAAAGVGVGAAEVAEIDELNVYHAGLLAMRRAVEALPATPEHLLVDARTIPDLEIAQNAFEGGDRLSFSIAAASIVAKVRRDRLMIELDGRYPEYGFASHKGYATPEHQQAIRSHGPCPAHRSSYAFIRQLCGEFGDAFYELHERLDGASDRDELDGFEEELGARRDELAEEEYRKLRALLGRRWKAVSST